MLILSPQTRPKKTTNLRHRHRQQRLWTPNLLPLLAQGQHPFFSSHALIQPYPRFSNSKPSRPNDDVKLVRLSIGSDESCGADGGDGSGGEGDVGEVEGLEPEGVVGYSFAVEPGGRTGVRWGDRRGGGRRARTGSWGLGSSGTRKELSRGDSPLGTVGEGNF